MLPAKESSKQVVLITGTSAGIGKACAQHLSKRGLCVYGTSRSAKFDSDPSKDGTNPVYNNAFKRALGVMENDESNGPHPVEIALVLEKILRHPAPPASLYRGEDVHEVCLSIKNLFCRERCSSG